MASDDLFGSQPVPWTPPALEDLDFATNCTDVRAFLQSWFDLTPYEDVGNMTGSELNVTFWVPKTLQSEVTERYFRQALPAGDRDAATYGQILQWEYSLRQDFVRSVREFVDEAAELEDSDALAYSKPYYDHVIHAPSRACRQEVCELGFDWDQLGDVNGPGVFIYYGLLVGIGLFYSFVALFDAFRYLRSEGQTYQPPAYQRERRSFRRDLYEAVRKSFSGFADGAAVFAVALPCALLYNYRQTNVRVSAFKDLILELWVMVFALCVAIWLWRIGAMIRRVDRAKYEAERGADAPGYTKIFLMTGIVLVPAALCFALMVAFGTWYRINNTHGAFEFEDFWNDFCDYGQGLSVMPVIIAMSSLLGYCVCRYVVLDLITDCLTRPKMESKIQLKISMRGPPKTPGQRRQYAAWARRMLYQARNKDPRYRKWSNRMGMVDIVVLGGGSIATLICYGHYRWRLESGTGFDSFSEGWSLGQILAVSSLVPVVLGFAHEMYEVRGRSRDEELRTQREGMNQPGEDIRLRNRSQEPLLYQGRASSQQWIGQPWR